MDVILNINDLKYKNIFNNLSIYIEKNKITTISGKNNCGKTTLIRILRREIKLDSNIILYGKNLNEYKPDEYLKIVRSVIPKEIIFIENTLEEELSFQSELLDKDKRIFMNYIVKGLKIKRMLNKEINTLSTSEIVLAQIAVALINHPDILLLDNIDNYLDLKELENVYNFLRDYRDKFGLTVIMTTIDLNQSLYSDYLYIIDEGRTLLSGEPITILQRDNLINKAGLNLPFMVDLSVKLRDYELITKLTLDMNRMVEELWKWYLKITNIKTIS